MFAISLLLFVFSLITFIVFAFVSFKNYRKIRKEKFLYRNHFPHELKITDSFKDNPFGNVLLIASSLLTIGFYISLFKYTRLGINNAIILSGVFFALFLALIYFFSFNFLKAHIGSFAFCLVFSLALSGFNSYKFISGQIAEPNILKLIFAILFSLISLICLVLILNPKLTFNLKMEEAKQGDSVVYARPKYFTLAVTEWIMYALQYLLMLLILLTFTL